MSWNEGDTPSPVGHPTKTPDPSARRGLGTVEDRAKELRNRMGGQYCANCGHPWSSHSTPDKDGYLSRCSSGRVKENTCKCGRWVMATRHPGA